MEAENLNTTQADGEKPEQICNLIAPLLERTKNPKFREALIEASKLTEEERLAEYDRRRKEESELFSATRKARLRSMSGFSPSDFKRTFASYTPKTQSEARAKQAIMKFAEQWPKKRVSLYIHSPHKEEERYGAGKSHLAVAYGIAVMDKGFTVRYWYMPDFIAEIRRSWSDEEFQTPVIAAKKCDLLILDDIEKDHWEPTTQLYPKVLQVLDYRSKEQKPIVITSNLKPDALKEDFGGNVRDRLRMCIEIEVAGPSGRARQTVRMPYVENVK